MRLSGHTGFTIWFTGLSGAGKTTLASAVAARLRNAGARVELFDGDVLRREISNDLGFSREDRDRNILRIGFLCEVLTRHGVIAIAAAISPYRETRDEVKRRIGRVLEVFVDCPLDVLSARDPKGLYKKALAGEIQNFTGVSDPYEPPLNPDVVVATDHDTVEEGVAKIVGELKRRNWFQIE